jgi:hypothetical protein
VALAIFNIDQANALAYGLVLNAIQLISLVVQGLIALPLAGVGIGDIRRARQELAAEV